jgi:hypothetical protein
MIMTTKNAKLLRQIGHALETTNLRDWARDIRDVADTHDELVSALRNITECAEAGADGANMDLWIEQARAALAKAGAL